MRDLPFFDANCDIGAPMNALPCHADGVADLYAEMDRMGVERALVKYLNVELIRNRFSGARTPARLPVRVRTQTG